MKSCDDRNQLKHRIQDFYGKTCTLLVCLQQSERSMRAKGLVTLPGGGGVVGADTTAKQQLRIPQVALVGSEPNCKPGPLCRSVIFQPRCSLPIPPPTHWPAGSLGRFTQNDPRIGSPKNSRANHQFPVLLGVKNRLETIDSVCIGNTRKRFMEEKNSQFCHALKTLEKIIRWKIRCSLS